MRKIIVLIFCMILLVGTASAWDVDNRKGELQKGDGISEYGKIEIKDWFGLLKLTELELKENTEMCPQKGCYAKKEITMYQDGILIDDIRFKSIEGNNKVNYTIKYKINEVWIEYALGDEVKGNGDGMVYEVILEGKLKPFSIVDWQIKSQGFWIEEWSVWTESLSVGCVAYWNFNETSGSNLPDIVRGKHNGTNYGSPNWVSGLIGNALNYSNPTNNYSKVLDHSDFDTNAFTIQTWINPHSIGGAASVIVTSVTQANLNGFYLYREIGGEIKFIFANVTQAYSITSDYSAPQNTWTHIVFIYSGTNLTIYLNGSLQTDFIDVTNLTVPYAPVSNMSFGIFDYDLSADYDGQMDEVGFWNRSLNSSEITQLYNNHLGISYTSIYPPIVGITYPMNTSYISQTKLNYTVKNGTAIPIDSCWYSTDGGTTNSLTQTAGLNWTGLSANYGSNTWTVYCNDTDNLVGEDSLTFTITDILETNISFNTTSYETASEEFVVNLSYDPTRWNEISANIVYNGTSHSTTKTTSGTNPTFTSIFDIPILRPEGSASQNITFYVEIALTNNTGTTYYNTTLKNQSISPLNISLEVTSYPSLNFTTWNEENLTRERNYDFYGTFVYWIGSGSIYKNFSFPNQNINETLIHLNQNVTYYANAQIQYEKTSPTFIKRSYYLENASLTDTLQHIELMLLLSSSSTSFIIEVIDESRIPVENAYVYIQRYYPSTGTFKTVEISQTDATGTTIGHFEEETEDYKIIITLDDIVVYESEKRRIICKETPCTITFQIGEIGTASWQDFGDLPNLVHSLSFDVSGTTWTYSYIDTSGTTNYGRLHVYSEQGDLITDICNESSTSAAATLTCNVSGNTGTIYAGSYISRSPELLLELKSAIVEGLKAIFGLEGLFLAMLVLMVLGLAGLWNPAVGIILEIVGVIFLNLLGIASFGATAIWGIIFIGLILLWEMKT